MKKHSHFEILIFHCILPAITIPLKTQPVLGIPYPRKSQYSITFKLLCMKKLYSLFQKDNIQELLLVALGVAIIAALTLLA